MEITTIKEGQMYQAWHPDGREIFIYRQLFGTARLVIYGGNYPIPQHNEAY